MWEFVVIRLREPRFQNAQGSPPLLVPVVLLLAAAVPRHSFETLVRPLRGGKTPNLAGREIGNMEVR